MRDAGACVKGVFDPLADGVFLAVGAVQVDRRQDTGAVAGPRGDLCGRAAGVHILPAESVRPADMPGLPAMRADDPVRVLGEVADGNHRGVWRGAWPLACAAAGGSVESSARCGLPGRLR
jgi:hypothetical protein